MPRCMCGAEDCKYCFPEFNKKSKRDDYDLDDDTTDEKSDLEGMK